MNGYAVASADATSAPVAAASSNVPWWVWPLSLFVVTSLWASWLYWAVSEVGCSLSQSSQVFFRSISIFARRRSPRSFIRRPGCRTRLVEKRHGGFAAVMPVALIASSCAIVGAMVGLALPTKIVQTALGAAILAIVGIMLTAKKSVYPEVKHPDALSMALRINGIYYEPSSDHEVNWQIHRTPQGLATFIIIGFMAGMFGLGAGWANVPVLNLMMGAPLKVAVATSKFLLSITDTSAAWIYMNRGAVLPMMVVPSIIGIMLGSIVGVRILAKTKPAAIRYIVIVLLLFAGLKALLKGLGI